MNRILNLIGFLFLFLIPTISWADPEPPVVDAPIDGGVSFLLIAGAALGGKKLYDYHQKQKSEE